MENEQSGFVRFLVGLGAFVLRFLLYVFLIVTILIANVRVLLSQNNLEKMISGILMPVSAPANRPVGAPMTGMEKRMQFDQSLSQEENEALLIEWVYELMEEELGEEIPVTVEQVKEFIEESTLEEFVSEKCAQMVNDFVNGENTVTLNVDEIMEQVEQNKELIEKTFEVEITHEMLNKVETALEENEVLEKIQEEGLEGVIMEAVGQDSELLEDMEEARKVLNTARKSISKETLMTGITICLVLAGLLFLLRWKRFWKAMRDVGWPMLWAGLLFLLPVVAVISSRSLLMDVTDGSRMLVDMLIQIMKMMLPLCAGVTIGGLVLIIAGFVVGGMMSKPHIQKVQAVNAVPVPDYVAQMAQSVQAPAAHPAVQNAGQPNATPVQEDETAEKADDAE